MKYHVRRQTHHIHGRSPYGERGLKYLVQCLVDEVFGRSPYGERGLKFIKHVDVTHTSGSLSLRRAWIEIVLLGIFVVHDTSRSPYGERGLKSVKRGGVTNRWTSRSPYGERGLKCGVVEGPADGAASLSLRRAWIEIPTYATSSPVF